MTHPERYWRNAAARYRADRPSWAHPARWLQQQARRCDLNADIIALEGVDLSPDAILAPCALTPGALSGES